MTHLLDSSSVLIDYLNLERDDVRFDLLLSHINFDLYLEWYAQSPLLILLLLLETIINPYLAVGFLRSFSLKAQEYPLVEKLPHSERVEIGRASCRGKG